MTIRVAVIGTGAAGLCALRHLTARPNIFQAVGFEKNSSEGGTWIYTEDTGTDKNGLLVQSSMYKNLRTNLPKEAMAFPDYPFKTSLPSFIRHQEVLDYLQDYSSHFDLKKHVQFDSIVKHVSPQRSTGNNKTKWELSYSDVTSQDKEKTELFDAIMVCNGHYEIPHYPKLPGQDDFKGEIIHSHNYRHPEDFTGKRVVCLGAAASGQDIAVDISKCAKHVYLSHNKPFLETLLPENVEQKQGVKELKANSVVLKNGEEVETDVLLLCTGYMYNLSFMSEEVGLKVENSRIWPLYKHVLHSTYPSLSIIGILKTICPFPVFDVQTRFSIAALDGSMILPSEEEMLQEIDEEFNKRMAEGLPIRHAHQMGKRQWKYIDELAEMADIKGLPSVIEKLFDYIHATRVKDIARYKSLNYGLDGNDKFVVLRS